MRALGAFKLGLGTGHGKIIIPWKPLFEHILWLSCLWETDKETMQIKVVVIVEGRGPRGHEVLSVNLHLLEQCLSG